MHLPFQVLLCGALACTASAASPAKKLIEFGWDEPDPAFMLEHRQQLEGSPFDGCVFHITALPPDGKPVNFTWEAWGTRRFAYEELKPAVETLRKIKFQRFTNNFLRFNTTPAKIDWFDEYSVPLHNAELAARVAREGGCPGLLFDIEQYDAPLFTYPRQRDTKTKSWSEYSAQVRRRGREVMDAFQRGYPGLTVFLTFGYSLPWTTSMAQPDKLHIPDYGLLAPFLDGMVAAATNGARLIDGFEVSYGYKEPQQFREAYRTMTNALLAIVADPQKYRQVFSFSFGLWMDQNWRKFGWDTNDFTGNYFTPETFEKSLRAALETADEYVWIYTEQPRWWSAEGGPIKVPVAYRRAVERARKE